ncbi:MAG: hypothetical protein ACJAYU_000449 [Bradymonadia bacterium]|jgi:hypothetical protein
MLASIQLRILGLMNNLPDRPILFGGGAIVGTVVSHRTTHDLDLMWSPAVALGPRTNDVERTIVGDGLTVERLVTSPAFVRIRVSDGTASTVVDLIAEPARRAFEEATIYGVPVLAPPPADLLIDKLCALLSRQEGRDLQDVRALIGAGQDLDKALEGAPGRDSGFSVLTLAWLLREWPMHAVAEAAGWDAETTHTMALFRDEFVTSLTSLT